MFGVYKTVHPPTGVDNSIYCNFLGPNERNLITSSTNRLQVYRLVNENNKSKKLKLECMETFYLFGNISSMASCRYGPMNKDALILAFDDAKLSIVEYDSFNGDLVTLSIHYFENELEQEGLNFNIYHPMLRVDPNMRCAVMLIYGCKLVVIPFYEDHYSNQPTVSKHEDPQHHTFIKRESNIKSEPLIVQQDIKFSLNPNDSTGFKRPTTSSLSSYSIDLRKLDDWNEMRIIDIEFLYGYYEPTLFILSEMNRTWVGRYAIKKDTCNSVALSLNLQQKTHPIIWPVDKLPSDCLRCMAVPPPIGGVLLFTVNGLIYINQSIPSYGVSLNSIAKTVSNYPYKNMEHTKLTLDCSASLFVAPDRLIVSLKGGEIYIITLLTDSESLRNIRQFNIEKGPSSVIPTCLTKCCDNYLFISSRLGNSVLLKYNAKTSRTTTELVADGISSREPKLPKGSDQSENEETEDEEVETNNQQATNLEELDYEHVINDPKSPSSGKRSATSADCDELDLILEKNEEQQNKSTNIVSYTFEICDMLLNIAPCGHTIVGESTGDYSEFETDTVQYHIDLVSSAGHSKHGAVSILQRGLRPEIIASFQIPEILDMWSVFSDTDTLSTTSPTYLFLSKSDSTMILQMGSEITELDKETSVFCTKYPTLCCTNLANNALILQVTCTSCFIYSHQQQEASLLFTYDLLPHLDAKIKSVAVCDPFVVILTHKGTIRVLVYDSDTTRLELVETDLNLSSVTCLDLYKDESGFMASLNSLIEEPASTTNASLPANQTLSDDKKANLFEDSIIRNGGYDHEMTIDDEDELLYGSSKTDFPFFKNPDDMETDAVGAATSSGDQSETASAAIEAKKLLSEESLITYCLATVTSEGVLNIYKLVDKTIVQMYSVAKFNMAPSTLVLNNHSVTVDNKNAPNPLITAARSSLIADTLQPQIHEIIMIGIGYDKKRPFLVARIDEDLVVYEGFIASVGSATLASNSVGNRQLNFKRLVHDAVIRDRKKRKSQVGRKTQNDLNQDTNMLDQEFHTVRTKHTPSLRSFTNIAGFDGFFTSGPHSYMTFICPRSGLTPHPIWIDGPINSFVPLKNASITMSGFIYLNKNFDIRIATLPAEDGKLQIYYDSPWVLRKCQLRQTVHFLCYHEESKTYAVVTSVAEPTNRLMMLGGEEKEIEEFEKDENFILPNRKQFYIQLYASSCWEPLPLGKYTLAEFEHVSCLKLVSLPYEGHASGFKVFLAAGTINCYTEDINARGRLIILDVIETVPEPDKPLTNTKMKEVFTKDQKGPVTCLESSNGFLLGSVGQKVYIWEFKNNELMGKAFIDTGFYIHKMIVLKNFLLIADLHRSVSLLKFQPKYTKLSFVAKDKRIIDAYACEYLVDNTNLAFISSDSEKNINVYMYQNESHDNQGGQWLIRKAEFNVGSHINSFFRLKCKVNDPYLDKRSSLADKRQVTYCSTLDGSLGFVIPISEKTFRRLFILQNTICVMKPHYAGLNPKAYRLLKGHRKELCNPQKNILDGDLLFEYFNMSYMERNDIAKKIKTNTEQLLDDLTEIFQLTAHF